MNKIVTALACLLVLQLVLAGTLWFVDSSAEQQQTQSKPLLAIDSKSFDKLEIKDQDDVLSLVRKEEQWQFNEHPELPIAPFKLSSVIEELSSKKVTWPVTQTTASHDRFNLTNDNFEKQLVVSNKKGESKTLIVGKSPSFKQIYVRSANDDDVYLIDFNAYQLSTDIDDWIDKSLLSITEITKVEHAKVNVEKQDDEWHLAEPLALTKEQVLEHDNVKQFVEQLSQLRVTGLADGDFKPAHQLTVFDADNSQYTYQFSQSESQYYVKRSDIDYWFTVGKSSFDNVAQLSLEQFVSNKESQQEDMAITSD